MDLSIHPPPIPKGRNNEQIQVHLIRQKANSPHFQAIEKIIPLAGPSSIVHHGVSSFCNKSTAYCTRILLLVYGYLHTVNCTVCLRIKYGYKAAEAVPTSPQ
jgi:hypothetical protein